MQNKVRMQCRKSALMFLRVLVVAFVFAGVVSVAVKADESDKSELFQVEFPEAGTNGYYAEKPEVVIRKMQPEYRICYECENGTGEQLTGALDAEYEEWILEKSSFSEGENRLKIWAEVLEICEEGEAAETPEASEQDGTAPEISEEEKIWTRVPDSEKEYTFLIDTIAPTLSSFQYPTQTGSIPYCYNAEVTVSLSATDSGSGIESVFYAFNAGEYQCIFSDRAEIVLPKNFRGRIKAYCVDLAGNCSETLVSEGLLCDIEVPEIQVLGIENGAITAQPILAEVKIADENVLKEASLELIKEDEAGNRENLLVEAVEKTETSVKYELNLTADGKYYLRAAAADMAEHQTQNEIEFIVDQTNPLIQYVDQLDGTFLQYFEWNYLIEDVIQDLTEYTFSMKLNNLPYIPGVRYLKEGKCVLMLQAKDAAGNVGAAQAEFVIDHTAPEISFGTMEEDEKYEKGTEMVISVSGADENMTSILVNGEMQKIGANCQSFRMHLQEAGTYIVEVKARDAARNESYAAITFEIAEKENLTQAMADLAKKITDGESENRGEDIKGVNADGNQDRQGFAGILCAAVLGTLGLMSVVWLVIWRRREKDRNSFDS